MDREPTADELAGMAWWNGLSEVERAYWLGVAGSAIVAEAWRAFKRSGEPVSAGVAL